MSSPTKITRLFGTIPLVDGRDNGANLSPGDIVGSYRILEFLDEGSMGRVFLAEHIRLARKVALKVLRSEHTGQKDVVQRFFQEAKTINQINHPHIVEVFDFVEDITASGSPRAYCVMEHLKGTTLAGLLREGALPLNRALHIAEQVCSALHAAHQVHVVHRDVKPDNIFIVRDELGNDFVKLLDFGVAKLLAPELPITSTLDCVVVGTPRYMSPEQASSLSLDHRADIYAVGNIVYEMLTGQPPFSKDEGLGPLLARIISESPHDISTLGADGSPLPSSLRSWVMSCLEKKPENRPKDAMSCAEFLQDVRLGRVRMSSQRKGAWAVLALAASLLLFGRFIWKGAAGKPTFASSPVSVTLAAPPPTLKTSTQSPGKAKRSVSRNGLVDPFAR